MTGHSNIATDIEGGPVRHVPVMLSEVLSILEPAPGKLFVDGTFGAGGYTSALLNAGAQVLAIDRDPNAIRDGAELVKTSGRLLRLVEGEFSNLDVIACENDIEAVDGVVLDVGVSSMQIDEDRRGFSFLKEGPLDMRMSQSGVSAADVVNNAVQADLTRIIGILGEERKASIVSRAIVKAREVAPILTTLQLSKVVEQALGRKAKDRIHPATRTFQALRIFVNQELEQLGKALFAAERLLKAGGRLAVVTFHSLEDRMVKVFFKDRDSQVQGSRHMPLIEEKAPLFEVKGKTLLKASAKEIEENPRARSAKLRWSERTSVAVTQADMSIFGLPNLASLETFTPAAGGA